MTPTSAICLQLLVIVLTVLGLVVLCNSEYRDTAISAVGIVITVLLAMLALGTVR